jgi:hypothetical protein
MRTNRTIWSLVTLALTLCSGALTFLLWRDLWLVAIVGAAVDGTVNGLQAPASGQGTWGARLSWIVATLVAAGCGMVAYSGWGSIGLALVIAVMAYSLLGAVLSLLAWFIDPTPLDPDALLSGPDGHPDGGCERHGPGRA